MNNLFVSFIAWVLAVFIIGFMCLLFISPFLIFGINSPSDGYKVGNVVNVSQKGFFHKTCECEMIKGGVANGANGAFSFTITSDEQCNYAKRLMDANKEVMIHYVKPWLYFKYNSNSGVFVDRVYE